MTTILTSHDRNSLYVSAKHSFLINEWETPGVGKDWGYATTILQALDKKAMWLSLYAQTAQCSVPGKLNDDASELCVSFHTCSSCMVIPYPEFQFLHISGSFTKGKSLILVTNTFWILCQTSYLKYFSNSFTVLITSKRIFRWEEYSVSKDLVMHALGTEPME